MFDEYDIISRYTRAQAIEDGTLIDVTTVAKEGGIKFPTAMTQAVWERYVRVPEDVTAQDEAGRLWDILWMMRHAVLRSNDESTIHFQMYVRNDNHAPRPVTLKAHCGPDDDARPCITIMLPEED